MIQMHHGQAATLRGLEILSNLGCDVRILQMEGAKDPDEYVIKYGNDRFNLLVDKAISLVEFKAKMLKNGLDLNNVNDKIKFLKQIAKMLADVNSKIEQELYIDKISQEYKISKEAIYAEINKMQTNKNIISKILEKRNPIKKITVNDNVSNVLVKRENTIIALLINEKNKAYEQIKNRITPDDFKSEANRKIIKKLYEEFEKGNSNITSIIDTLDNEELISRITEIMSDDYEMNDQKAIENLINIYEKEKMITRKQEIITKLNENKNSNQTKNLEQELHTIITKLAKG